MPQYGGRAASVTGAIVLSHLLFCVGSVPAALMCDCQQTPSPSDAHCNKSQAVRLSLGYYFYLVVISFVFCHL